MLLMNEIAVFENKQFGKIRTINDNEQIWFVARDIAEALEYKGSTINNAISVLFQSVPDIWKGKKRIFTLGGEQEMLCLSEQGLYFFLGRSDKKKALPYQMWIAGEVVPSIRKHGAYVTPAKLEDILSDPDAWIKTLEALKAEREKVAALTAKAQEDRPKVIFAEAVDASKDSILIGNLAKLLSQNGIKIGQNKLFAWLRENGYLIGCKGERWNFPMQSYVDRGFFEVKKTVVNNPDGTTRITHTTKVTGKGQIYFINGFLDGSLKYEC